MKFKNLFTMLMVSLLCLTIISCKGVSSDESPEIVVEENSFSTLTDLQTTYLAGLAKVWGFLKYHHPVVTQGDLVWDSVLLDAITDTKAAQDKNAFNQVIDDLIVLAGNPDGSGSGDVPSTFSWM
ncbi:MAG: hypothetical protein GY757_20935, partial [bacterium]|nr:hypothetical protein [bacterium]